MNRIAILCVLLVAPGLCIGEKADRDKPTHTLFPYTTLFRSRKSVV